MIFYTMATRAMHQLIVLQNNTNQLLEKADPATYALQLL